ncbi:hypothetical protein Dda_6666 [Drechslerella dactyloides]|uniref:PA14 domain-containing protein n=1 Tax=Drechslerella dactyloides TaxID=74499 RepID=A0AAD6IVA7_DREDA|nr:hypothetical protein Dda_6666 [Drechslerella dactyloides]
MVELDHIMSCFLTSTSTVQGGSGGATVTTTITTTVQTTDSTLTVTSTSTSTVTSGVTTRASTSTVVIDRTFGSVVLAGSTTTVSNVITTGGPLPETGCSNYGLEVAVYTNPFAQSGGGLNYPSFSPQAFKTITPVTTGTATLVGLSQAAGQTPYGLTPVDTASFVVNHRGYFYAPRSATYTFNAQVGDDYVAFWLGSKAFSDWTRQNADGSAIYNGNQNPNSGSATRALGAGTYTPLRIIYANSGGAVTLTFSITDGPGGNTYVSGTQGSPYLVKSPCEPRQGMAFLNPFGEESVSADTLPNLTCGTGGVDVALYDVTDPGSSSGFPPQNWKHRKPLGATITNRIGFAWDTSWEKPYGLVPDAAAHGGLSTFILLNYRGYFWAPTAGTYTFSVSNVDNTVTLWGGNQAVSGWNGDNGLVDVPDQGATDSGTATLSAGQYYPIRVILASWGGAAGFSITIRGNSGVYYLRTNLPSPFLLTAPCPAASLANDQSFKNPFGEES